MLYFDESFWLVNILTTFFFVLKKNVCFLMSANESSTM